LNQSEAEHDFKNHNGEF